VHRKRYQEQRNFAGWLSFLVAASLLAFPRENSCCAAPTSAPVELSPILIGVSNVQTGPASILGQNLVLGSTAYFDLVNQNGGVGGRKISIILKDDKYEPDLEFSSASHEGLRKVWLSQTVNGRWLPVQTP
jgi:ABC-type branched-subunit amino acid transport system substrate-binding protein